MQEWDAQWQVVWHVVYAMVLAGSIGVERELKNRPAGFRTHMLVGGAAAFLVGIGGLLLEHSVSGEEEGIVADPFRLVEAVIAGVAFIGAGTIFAQRRSGVVIGITTAASLLMVAVLGVAVGFGYHLLAGVITVITLGVLVLLSWIENWINRRKAASG